MTREDNVLLWLSMRKIGSDFRSSTVFLQCFIVVYSLCCDSLKANCFHHISKFVGQNFPTNGPVLQNKTKGCEPSTEKMTVHGETVKGDVPMFLKLEGGENHKYTFTTTYKYVGILRTKIYAFC